MSETTLLRKDQLETSLHNERKLIEAGQLKEDNPLDLSEPFRVLCEACRKGDLKVCQEKISEGVNINARDLYDYTPLILASLCGHYEVVQFLLDSGALCERDTFQGERCLYNALNDRIRNLLLQYDYSKSADPLQPFAAHLTSLLSRGHPQTSDIVVTAAEESFKLHKFILSARSPYFHNKLSAAPEATTWKLPNTIPPQAFSAGIRYLYLGEAPRELRSGPGTGFTEEEVLTGIDRISKHLELNGLVDTILESGDRRLIRQRRSDEIAKGRDQMEAWFRDNVLRHKIVLETDKVGEVKWDRNNTLFADVLLQADELLPEVGEEEATSQDIPDDNMSESLSFTTVIPVGPARQLRPYSRPRQEHRSTLFPAHRAMLLRSELFLAMFSSGFREAQMTEHLQIIPVDCSPEVLETVLSYLYTEKAEIPLDLAVDVLFAADLLLMDRLKSKAALVISSLGNGNMVQSSKPRNIISTGEAGRNEEEQEEEEEEAAEELIDVYQVIRAAWLTRVQRLEEFGARYLAFRLESHIDTPEFEELILESANRVEKRQETDTIELLDDIRYYLSERFRLRFEDTGLDEMMEEKEDEIAQAQNGIISLAEVSVPSSESYVSKNPSESASPREPKSPEDEGVDVSRDADERGIEFSQRRETNDDTGDSGRVIRTLDGEVAGDEFARDAINYQILLNKLDSLLEKLHLDA